jgi:hypothetical protein
MVHTLSCVAKHAFAGDAKQAQISFPQGATLTAKSGQEGNAWWWGSYNGREGWFPPAYVTVAPQINPAVTAAFAPQNLQSMQQKMQQVTFTSSVQQQQARQAFTPSPLNPQGGFQQQPKPTSAFGQPAPAGYGQPTTSGFGQPAQTGFGGQSGFAPQPAATGFGVAAASGGFANGFSDPFEGLDASPAPAMSTFQSQSLPAPTASARPVAAGQMSISSLAPIATASSTLTTPPVVAQPRTAAAPVPAASQQDAAAAAAQRLGLPARAMSPTPPAKTATAHDAAAIAAARARVVSPVPTTTTQDAAVRARVVSPVPHDADARSRVASPVPPARPPQQVSKDDAEAKRVREKEQAAIKAQLLKEKEELAKEQAATTPQGGLGSSGVTIATTGPGHLDVGSSMLFNPYDFLAGTNGQLPNRKFSPIFRVPPFWALLGLNTYVRQFPVTDEKQKEISGKYEQLAKALSFVCHVSTETENLTRTGRGRFGIGKSQQSTGKSPLAFLRSNHMACEACIKLIGILPHSAGASGKQLDQLFLNFINVLMSLIENLQPNQQLVFPGGWQRAEYGHVCLYILRNCGNNKFSFTVCNTGRDGLQYHPSSFDSETGRQLKQMAMTVWDIPHLRIMDSTFWVVLFRMQVYPSKKNDAAFLYTKLLPSLNSQPLMSNLDQGPHEFLEPPDAISDLTFHPLALLALTTTPAMGARTAKYSSLMVMNAAVDLAYAEIENASPSSMDPEDSRILKMTGRNLANFASTLDPMSVGDGTLGATLSSTWDLLDKLLKKISFASSKPTDEHTHGLSAKALSDSFSKGVIPSLRTEAGSVAHPLFGRLRRDNYDNVVKALMGDPRPDPILIPSVLTDETLPPIAIDYATATSSLQRIADACSLLLQQRRLVKNAPAFAASAAQYALTTVLPMPNLNAVYCFWRKNPMRRETQVNLLFLIRRICRIYSAATICVQQSRGLIAIRSTAFACAACVSDAICRVKAVDDPSTFALHYSGLCEGPTQPFGIEAGAFESLASNLPIYDPNICSLRFQCLDYLRGLNLRRDGTLNHTIFNFDVSDSSTTGDVVLITQLAIQLALPRPYPATDEAKANHATTLISGRNGAIVEVLPDFEYFRDIVFHFKHSVSGKAQAVEPKDNKAQVWFPSDAILRWDVKRKEKEDPALVYTVLAFQGFPQDFVDKSAAIPTADSGFQGFLSLFGKSKAERQRLSSADPTTVVNSCGEKFQKSR